MNGRYPRGYLYGLIAALAVILAVIAVLLLRARETEPRSGDLDETLAGMAVSDMPDHAAAFLATDRPWRAAIVMRSYARNVRRMPADRRVLAARAEAGWGGWAEVRTLLENVPALDTYDDGIGLYLLGRARDEAGDAAGAVEAYRAFLALSPPAGALEDERGAARLRLALALIRQGNRESGRRDMQASAERAGGASIWLELLEADALAHAGDTAAVRAAVARFDSGITGLRAWRARITAARQARDLPGAGDLAMQARSWARTSDTRAEFLLAGARAALDMRDLAAGRAALRGTIAEDVAGAHARAAADLLRAGQMTPADHLAVARVNRAQGLHQESLEGYRTWLDSRQGSAAERAAVTMEYANALFYAERYDEVPAALRPIAGQTAARLLHARAEAHRGNTDEAVRIYLTVPGTQALFLAASARHDDNDVPRARELYRRVLARSPNSTQAQLTMMRLAGIAFVREEFTAAAQMWDQYRGRFPRGAHAVEATYWAAQARSKMGDSAAAAALFRTVRDRARDSYYGLRASERLGEPFWPVPMAAVPPDEPAAAERVVVWMRGIDLLRAAGFPDEASAEASRVVTTAGGDRATRYALAEALAERGYTQRAIQIGLGLQGSGPTNRRLLRIMYPFPYRTLITEEARSRDFDPFVAAALIRQESMFESRITSPAGARGLMQIMPATGRRLAQAAGIKGWDPETLYHPEINVHLGIRYLAQHSQNYDGRLPPIFSAYNAGAHRVEWWSTWPEYREDELFTERIPFAETRGYVRILTRNHALYRGLYEDTN